MAIDLAEDDLDKDTLDDPDGDEEEEEEVGGLSDPDKEEDNLEPGE